MRVIGIVSGKGGVGKTTLVANLGVAIKSFGKDVAAVDCNMTTSHLGFNFGLYYYPVTLNNVLKGEASLSEAIYQHSSGLKIIPASLSTNDLIGVDIDNIKSVLDFEDVEIVLLDSAPGLGREAMSVLNACNEVLFVTVPYLNAVADIKKCFELTKRIGVRPLGLALNMVRGDSHELTASQIEEVAGLPVISRIPFDVNIQRSLARGMPAVSYNQNSKASLAIKSLAANIVDVPHVKEKGIFSRIYDFLTGAG